MILLFLISAQNSFIIILKIVAVNNIELDHIDIFRDLEDIKKKFFPFGEFNTTKGFLIINGDDHNLEFLKKNCFCNILLVGKAVKMT